MPAPGANKQTQNKTSSTAAYVYVKAMSFKGILAKNSPVMYKRSSLSLLLYIGRHYYRIYHIKYFEPRELCFASCD